MAGSSQSNIRCQPSTDRGARRQGSKRMRDLRRNQRGRRHMWEALAWRTTSVSSLQRNKSDGPCGTTSCCGSRIGAECYWVERSSAALPCGCWWSVAAGPLQRPVAALSFADPNNALVLARPSWYATTREAGRSPHRTTTIELRGASLPGTSPISLRLYEAQGCRRRLPRQVGAAKRLDRIGL
jgi:hypothetical protein